MSRLAAFLLACLLLALPAQAATRGEPLFAPVLQADFPDAFVLPNGNEFLAYATNPGSGHVNVQMAVSTNLSDWQLLRDARGLHDALPVLPGWARPGRTWAPEVIAIGSGYALYFTAQDRQSGLQCVGVGTATDPRGPFVSKATAPLVCQRDLGGTIDPSPFRDADGRLYLYFKDDGNNPAARKPVRLFAQPLSADGLSVVGEPIEILAAEAGWEGRLIEAPSMVRAPDGGYVLFFSANNYGWPDELALSPYAMGYANCRGPLGPCAAAAENPILHSFHAPGLGCLSGPGHQSIFQVGSRYFLTFHAWQAAPDCHKGDPRRFLYLSPFRWEGDKPIIGRSLRPTGAYRAQD
jgi:beta-xylosidase